MQIAPVLRLGPDKDALSRIARRPFYGEAVPASQPQAPAAIGALYTAKGKMDDAVTAAIGRTIRDYA